MMHVDWLWLLWLAWMAGVSASTVALLLWMAGQAGRMHRCERRLLELEAVIRSSALQRQVAVPDGEFKRRWEQARQRHEDLRRARGATVEPPPP